MRAFLKPQLVSTTQRFASTAFRQPAQRTFTSSTSGSQTRWQTSWRRAQQQQQQGHQQQTRGYRRPLNYQRFQATSGYFRKWAQHPNFRYHIAGIGGTVGGVYVYNLEEVPVSHRRRFNIVGPSREAEAGKMMYQQTMEQFGNQILPDSHPKSRMVQRVLNRLIPHSGLEGEEWEVHVINDQMKNAFVIPGGKVFVFSGILDVCQDDDGLAAVLGHEIAHNVAHHAAERMSKSGILLGVVMAGFLALGIDPSIGNFVTEYAFTRPGSRSQESEADYIGLLMMSESCYRPDAAMDLWARMEKEEQAAPPQFLSTHPSNHNRLEKIRSWLPQAEAKRDASECSTMNGWGM
jgi:predicted Zn-dependent protease